MKKQILALSLISVGLLAAAGTANAGTIIDIGTNPYSTTFGAWGSDTIKQQDKLWNFINDQYTVGLDPSTVVNFSLDQDAVSGKDSHSLQIIPIKGTLPETIQVHYTIAIDLANAPNAYLTKATVGIDNAGNSTGQASSYVTKILNDGALLNQLGNPYIEAYRFSPVGLDTSIITGGTTTFIDVKETLHWVDGSYKSASNTFEEQARPPLPEPFTLSLFGVGLFAMRFFSRRKA